MGVDKIFETSCLSFIMLKPKLKLDENRRQTMRNRIIKCIVLIGCFNILKSNLYRYKCLWTHVYLRATYICTVTCSEETKLEGERGLYRCCNAVIDDFGVHLKRQ